MDRAPKLKPWYREPWPWLLMIAPLAAVAGGAVTIALAMESFDGLVAEDYYKQGLAVNQRLARADRAQVLGINGMLKVDASANGAARAELEARGVRDEALVLTLSHPTRAGLDQRVILRATGEERYAGSMAVLAPGRWQVIVEDGAGQWRIRGELQVPQRSTVRLGPGA